MYLDSHKGMRIGNAYFSPKKGGVMIILLLQMLAAASELRINGSIRCHCGGAFQREIAHID